MGTLCYGDDLDILRRDLTDETVDLVDLDASFNSSQTYRTFLHEKDGTGAVSRMRTAEDTWSWNRASEKAHRDPTAQSGRPAKRSSRINATLHV